MSKYIFIKYIFCSACVSNVLTLDKFSSIYFPAAPVYVQKLFQVLQVILYACYAFRWKKTFICTTVGLSILIVAIVMCFTRRKIKRKLHNSLCHNSQHCECCVKLQKKIKKLRSSEVELYSWEEEVKKMRIRKSRKGRRRKKCNLLWCCAKVDSSNAIPLEECGASF